MVDDLEMTAISGTDCQGCQAKSFLYNSGLGNLSLTLPVLSGYLDNIWWLYRNNWQPRVCCRDHLGGLSSRDYYIVIIDSLEPDAVLPSEVISGVVDVPTML